VPCINTKNGDNILYFSNVIDEYVKTLDRHNKETIIIHTKKKKKKKKKYYSKKKKKKKKKAYPKLLLMLEN